MYNVQYQKVIGLFHKLEAPPKAYFKLFGDSQARILTLKMKILKFEEKKKDGIPNF